MGAKWDGSKKIWVIPKGESEIFKKWLKRNITFVDISYEEKEIPENLLENAQKFREEMLESVAEASEELKNILNNAGWLPFDTTNNIEKVNQEFKYHFQTEGEL